MPAGWLVVSAVPAEAEVEVCLGVGVIIPNTPVVLRQHPCVPVGLESFPPDPPATLGLPALPVAEPTEATADLCLEVSSDVDGVPPLDEGACQTVPLVTPPPGVVPGLPQVPAPAIPPSIPPIPPHIPGTPPLPPLPPLPVPLPPLPIPVGLPV
jgi:hypothetical protein